MKQGEKNSEGVKEKRGGYRKRGIERFTCENSGGFVMAIVWSDIQCKSTWACPRIAGGLQPPRAEITALSCHTKLTWQHTVKQWWPLHLGKLLPRREMVFKTLSVSLPPPSLSLPLYPYSNLGLDYSHLKILIEKKFYIQLTIDKIQLYQMATLHKIIDFINLKMTFHLYTLALRV